MQTRLAAVQEDAVVDEPKAAYLRRKPNQGKGQRPSPE
jgi:hypothetical protein